MWKSGNTKEFDLWTAEFSGVLPKEEILRAYDNVMNRDPENGHNFFFVDFRPKKHHPSPHRMKYTDWILRGWSRILFTHHLWILKRKWPVLKSKEMTDSSA
jgi:hypothetical protein